MTATPANMAPRGLVNNRWVLARRPAAAIPTRDDLRHEQVPIPALAEDEILIRTMYFSLDVHQAFTMDSQPSWGAGADFMSTRLPSIPLDENAIRADGVGVVIESRDARFQRGDVVEGYVGWQTYSVCLGDSAPECAPISTESAVVNGVCVVRRVDTSVAPPSTSLHVLGEFGLTAYVGMAEICDPQRGETVFVSSAAGVIGGVAGQVAKIKGCRVIGSVGSKFKADYCINELGFDGVVNYKAADAAAQLEAACPEGIDVFVDTVAGDFAYNVLEHMRPRGRVAVIGTTAERLGEHAEHGPRMFRALVAKRIRLEGFLLWDFLDRYVDCYRDLRRWYSEGRLRCHEQIIDGIEAAPEAFDRFLRGHYKGKAMVAVAGGSADPDQTP